MKKYPDSTYLDHPLEMGLGQKFEVWQCNILAPQVGTGFSRRGNFFQKNIFLACQIKKISSVWVKKYPLQCQVGAVLTACLGWVMSQLYYLHTCFVTFIFVSKVKILCSLDTWSVVTGLGQIFLTWVW